MQEIGTWPYLPALLSHPQNQPPLLRGCVAGPSATSPPGPSWELSEGLQVLQELSFPSCPAPCPSFHPPSPARHSPWMSLPSPCLVGVHIPPHYTSRLCPSLSMRRKQLPPCPHSRTWVLVFFCCFLQPCVGFVPAVRGGEGQEGAVWCPQPSGGLELLVLELGSSPGGTSSSSWQL